jgi:hypothetical protein
MDSVFRNTLHALLTEELGLKDKPVPRHRRDRFSPTITAKTQRAIPKSHEIDPSLHPKVEQLRNSPHGKIVINDADVKKICGLYNIKNLTADEPRDCGTTGIKIQYDYRLGKYKLTKGEKH